MHQRFVVFTTKHSIGGVNNAGALALVIDELVVPSEQPLYCRTDNHITALGTGNSAPDQQQLTLRSTRTTSRFWIVRFTAPKMTGHALTGENPARVLRLADGAGHIV
jgi:hypothetical protein